jgi:glutathione synthase/RimK-type ligase-like ATP-grasp enzyme
MSSPEELPVPLTEHDIAIVIASGSEEFRDVRRIIDRVAARWPRPMLNPPRLVCNLDRDKLHQLLRGIEGLDIPATVCVTRAQLSEIAQSSILFADIAAELEFPIIVRPRGSHAGVGLAKVDDRAAIARYLAERPEQEFFVSRFVDYADDDGFFRKCRIVVVDGRPTRVIGTPIGGISSVSQRRYGVQRKASEALCAARQRLLRSSYQKQRPRDRWRSNHFPARGKQRENC